MKNHFFINVLINLPLDKYYTYKVNNKYKRKIEIGSIVSMPFGKNNEIIKGVVISIINDFKSNYIIKKILDDQNKNVVFTKKQIKFFKSDKRNVEAYSSESYSSDLILSGVI